MNWKDFISQYPAKLVIEWTGAPKRTVYGWRDGSSSPYDWQQPIFRAWILRKAEQDAGANGNQPESRLTRGSA